MLVTIAYILISAMALLFVIFHFFGNREIYQKTSHIHGPLSFPLIGSAYLFIGDATRILMPQFFKLCDTFSSPFRLILGPAVMIVIYEPEQIKSVLYNAKTVEKQTVYKFVKPWLGNGLVTAPGEVWRVHRKLIQPAFTPTILRSFVQIFQKNSLLCMQALSVEVDRPEFEISSYLNVSSFSNICESSLGVSAESEKEAFQKYVERGEIILHLLVKRLFSPWLHPDILFNLSQTSKTFYDSVKYVTNFTTNIIQKRKEELKSKSSQNEEELVGQKKPFLDLLLKMPDNQKFTDEEIREHVDTMISAGYDTVARTNAFLLLMLASHPEIQDKVYEELYNIYGSETPENVPVKYEDLKQMEYLERVIKETLRLFPVAPLLGRKMINDFSLDGCNVPKGSEILILTIKLHRYEKIWPNALKFDPDRFLPEEVEKRHPCAFIPFSFGPRDCIGRAYAMMAIKVLVANVLRKYILKKDKITPVEDINLKVETLLTTTDPIAIRIEERFK